MKEMAKHSVLLGERETSVTIENPFWMKLKQYAKKDKISLRALIEQINDEAKPDNGYLAPYLRLYVFNRMEQEDHNLYQEYSLLKARQPGGILDKGLQAPVR